MINFDPEITIASALPDFKDPEGRAPEHPEFAGVSFTLHQITEGKRIKLRIALAEETANLREMQQSVAATSEGVERESVSAALNPKAAEIFEDKIFPARLKLLLVRIDGLTIKGKPATPDLMIESGPIKLYNEITTAINKMLGIGDVEAGKSEPRSTSSASADGPTSNTSADGAGSAANTSEETAAEPTQAMSAGS